MAAKPPTSFAIRANELWVVLESKETPIRRMEKALKAFSIAFMAFSELCLSDTIDALRFALILRIKIIRCYYIALSNKTQHSFCKNFAIHFRENFTIHVIMHRFRQKFRLHPSPQERFSKGIMVFNPFAVFLHPV